MNDSKKFESTKVSQLFRWKYLEASAKQREGGKRMNLRYIMHVKNEREKVKDA